MTTLSMRTEIIFGIEDCYVCGTKFGLPADFQKNRREDHASFYCPNGHPQAYVAKTEAEKLRDQLTSAQGTITHLRDQVDAATRARKRVQNGVCPCCNRTFANLARHMSSKHPDVAA